MDPTAPLPGAGGDRQEGNHEGFDRQEVLQHLNFDCLDLGRDGESDSEAEVRTAPKLCGRGRCVHCIYCKPHMHELEKVSV